MALKFMSINRSIIIYNIELFKSKLCKHVYFYSVLKVIARSCYSNIIPLMFGLMHDIFVNMYIDCVFPGLLW